MKNVVPKIPLLVVLFASAVGLAAQTGNPFVGK